MSATLIVIAKQPVPGRVKTRLVPPLTHEQAATDNLFSMAKRYHDNVPETLRHPTQAANAKELAFEGRDCSYSVATAGT